MEDSHTDPHLYVGSVPVESDRRYVGTPRSKDAKLISREIIFEEFQPL